MLTFWALPIVRVQAAEEVRPAVDAIDEDVLHPERHGRRHDGGDVGQRRRVVLDSGSLHQRVDVADAPRIWKQALADYRSKLLTHRAPRLLHLGKHQIKKVESCKFKCAYVCVSKVLTLRGRVTNRKHLGT